MQKSKKILFFVPYPVGNAPSQRFRFEQYFKLISQNGYQLSVFSFLSNRAWIYAYQKGKVHQKILGIAIGFIRRIFNLPNVLGADYVFIHREITPLGPPIFEWIITKIFQKRVIYDFDDAIWLDDPSEKGSFIARIKWKSKISTICGMSYKISCGNQYLCEFARQHSSKIVLNPTTIDTDSLHNPKFFKKPKDKILRIGWTGTHSTLVYLDEIIPVLEHLQNEYEFEFVVIANKRPDIQLKNLVYLPWSLDTEISDLAKLDIGVMPLTDDVWSMGKCGFKILQYMAMEIPALASPVGVNTKIVRNGYNGFLCNNLQDWSNHLKSLILSEDLRKSIGKNGRQYVIDKFSVESNTQNFLSLFE